MAQKISVWKTLWHIWKICCFAIYPSLSQLKPTEIAKMFDKVLPQELLHQVQMEAEIVSNYVQKQPSNLQHGKSFTYWMKTLERKKNPRCAIEQSILFLLEYDFPILMERQKVLGAEWWIQKRNPKEDIGFHFDKDEGMASMHMKMKHPYLSTILYLTSIGGPTLILNQTTDGNIQFPIIPTDGVLSFPLENKHVVFNGNLQHGVVGALAKKNSNDAYQNKKRLTLLVNWWITRPMKPYCRTMNTNTLKALGIYQEQNKENLGIDKTSVFVRQPFFPKQSFLEKNAKDLLITIPPNDLLRLKVPESFTREDYYFVWKSNESFGGVGVLNPLDQSQMTSILYSKLPIVYTFCTTPHVVDSISFVLDFAKAYLHQFKFFVGDAYKCGKFLESFQITIHDLPIVVVQSSSRDSTTFSFYKFKISLDSVQLSSVLATYLKDQEDTHVKDDL